MTDFNLTYGPKRVEITDTDGLVVFSLGEDGTAECQSRDIGLIQTILLAEQLRVWEGGSGIGTIDKRPSEFTLEEDLALIVEAWRKEADAEEAARRGVTGQVFTLRRNADRIEEALNDERPSEDQFAADTRLLGFFGPLYRAAKAVQLLIYHNPQGDEARDALAEALALPPDIEAALDGPRGRPE